MNARAQALFEAADAYFLSDVQRRRSANELAYTRIGILGSLAVGASTLAYLPVQRPHWPGWVLGLIGLSGALCVALPFALRRRDAIRGLGHFVCANLTVYMLAIVLASGGRATGVLPVLPMIPMFALLMRGGRAVVGWGLASAVVLGAGALLAARGAPPLVPDFRDFDTAERYPIALVCLAAMFIATLLFEHLWARSAQEVADQARAELDRAHANYQDLVEHSFQGMAVVSGLRLVYANEAMARLFGRPRERFVGMPILESLQFVHPDDRERIFAALSKPVHGRSDVTEMRFQRDDGDWCWVELQWSSALWEGRRARQIVFSDVTAQRELEATRRLEQERLETRIAERTRELEASQQSLRARERLAAVGTLAAGMAHQINNPVGAILAAADFALIAGNDPDAERVRASALEEIRAQAVRCGQVIRSILQFSRAESTEKARGDLVGVLRAAVDASHRLARDRDAAVVLDVDAAVAAAPVWLCAIELEQVFVNLILNAIQAQPSGARVVITARCTLRDVEICVEDDGPGILAADRERIFDPFFTTRLKDGGTGLGLSVAHGIVADHGGRMDLLPRGDDTVSGARFRVRLPIDGAERPGAPKRLVSAASPPGDTRRARP